MMILIKYKPLRTEKKNLELEHLEFRLENPYAAKHLRLGFHGCMKNDHGTGGCNGYLNLQKMEDSLDQRMYDLNNEGRGVSGHVGLLLRCWNKFTPIHPPPPGVVPLLSALMLQKGMSIADLWAVASILAVEMGTVTVTDTVRSQEKEKSTTAMFILLGTKDNRRIQVIVSSL